MAVPANVYVDTSALLKRVVDEPGSTVVRSLLIHPDFRGRLFLAAHSEPELISALNEQYRQTILGHREVEVAVTNFRRIELIFAIVPLVDVVVNDASRILNSHRRSRIRAGDALHLAAMRYAGSNVLRNERFVLATADRPMIAVARQLGLETWNPEKHGLSLLYA